MEPVGGSIEEQRSEPPGSEVILGLRLAVVCARKARLLPVGVKGQRSHNHVGYDYRKGIHPYAVANPQKRNRHLETTHGPGSLTEVRTAEEGRRYPPETIKH